MRPVLALLLAASVLSGCATLRSDITEFHSLPPQAESLSYTVLPARKELNGSLEFETYAEQVRRGMRAKGFRVVEPGAPADLIAFLDYGIDRGRQEVSTYSIPQWGVKGYSGARTTGTVSTYGNTSYLNATTTATPIYGVTGYTQGVSSSRVFTRNVYLDVVDLRGWEPNQPLKNVYQGRLRSEGSCGNIAAVMPALIDALLKDFPGQSGKTRRVDQRLDQGASC